MQDKDLLPLIDALASLLPKFSECSQQLQGPAAAMFDKAMKLAALQLSLRQAPGGPSGQPPLSSAGAGAGTAGGEYDHFALACSLDLVRPLLSTGPG